jgi:hypothetical protein
MGWKRVLGKIVDSISNSCSLGVEDFGTRTNRELVFSCSLLPSVYTIMEALLRNAEYVEEKEIGENDDRGG